MKLHAKFYHPGNFNSCSYRNLILRRFKSVGLFFANVDLGKK